jgi:hypothetical protein
LQNRIGKKKITKIERSLRKKVVGNKTRDMKERGKGSSKEECLQMRKEEGGVEEVYRR